MEGGWCSSAAQASRGDLFLLDSAVHRPLMLAWHSPPLFSIDFWHQKNTDYNNSPFHISQCFVLKLSDLQTVNVGLFDQYFRLTGE